MLNYVVRNLSLGFKRLGESTIGDLRVYEYTLVQKNLKCNAIREAGMLDFFVYCDGLNVP
jgi:hypothetical protein